MAKNRLLLAWDALTNGNKNLFNNSIYKMVGGLTMTYNKDLETLLYKGYGENPDVNANNSSALLHQKDRRQRCL
jgi:hypothetical protein